MTSEHILSRLVGFKQPYLWSAREVVAVANSNTLLAYEADLLIIQPSGFIHEVEIKISKSDVKAEFEKKAIKHLYLQGEVGAYPRRPRPKTFSIAMPKDLFPQVEQMIPSYCGIILVSHEKHLVPQILREGQELPGATKTDADFRNNAYRLQSLRSWKWLHRHIATRNQETGE